MPPQHIHGYTRTASFSLSCYLSLSRSLTRSLACSHSLILALLPRLPYSLLLHIPRRSYRLWISPSPPGYKQKKILHTFIPLLLLHTDTHPSVDCVSANLTHGSCLARSFPVGVRLSPCKSSLFFSLTEEQLKDYLLVFGSWSLAQREHGGRW